MGSSGTAGRSGSKPRIFTEHLRVWNLVCQTTGWSARDIIELIGFDNVNRITVGRWLRGEHRISQRHLSLFVEAASACKALSPYLLGELVRLSLENDDDNDYTPAMRDIITRSNLDLQKHAHWNTTLRALEQGVRELLIEGEKSWPSGVGGQLSAIFFAIFSFYCDFYSDHTLVTRACLYTRTGHNSNYLKIFRKEGIGDESEGANCYYVGDDPTRAEERGFPGWTFLSRKAAAVPNAPTDPRWHECRFPPRTPEQIRFPHILQLPVFAPIERPGEENLQHLTPEPPALAVLATDSATYQFSMEDAKLMEPVAQLIGWLLHKSGINYYSENA